MSRQTSNSCYKNQNTKVRLNWKFSQVLVLFLFTYVFAFVCLFVCLFKCLSDFPVLQRALSKVHYKICSALRHHLFYWKSAN